MLETEELEVTSIEFFEVGTEEKREISIGYLGDDKFGLFMDARTTPTLTLDELGALALMKLLNQYFTHNFMTSYDLSEMPTSSKGDLH